MSKIEADDVAIRGHRVYVFGVVFASLFILSFLLLAAIVSDLPRQVDPLQALDRVEPNRKESQTTVAKLRAAEQDAKQARERLSAAELALFRYLFDQLEDSSSPAAVDRLPSAAQQLQTSPDANPQVTALEHELAEALQRRSALLERLTPSHPEFQSLEALIADLQSRLDSIRKTKVIEPSTMPHDTPIVAAPDPVVPATETTLQKAQELMLAAGRAEAAYKVAVANASNEWTAYDRQSSLSETPGVISIGPAVTQPVAGIPIPRPTIALGAMLLLSVALAMFAAGNARIALPTFASAADVSARLNIPVLGQLRWTDGASGLSSDGAVNAGGDPRWLRRLILVGEIVLALALGGMLVLAITDSAMLRQIADDPLSGFAQAIAKLRNLAGV